MSKTDVGEVVERLRKQAYRHISDRAAMKAGYGVSVSPDDQDETEELLDTAADLLQSLSERVEELEKEKEHLRLQAQVQAQEALTQTSTVHEIYQECTGKTGEPGSWNGARPVKEALAEARNQALEEAAQIARNACLVPPDGGSPTEDEAKVCEEAARQLRSLKHKG